MRITVPFVSHWRTGNFLFFPRNGLSDSVTACSVPQEIREDRDRARLDSMVLLIMKLDQLDQDIENALSSSSSPSSTPTSLRRQVPVSFPPPASHVWMCPCTYRGPLENETSWMAQSTPLRPLVFHKDHSNHSRFHTESIRDVCDSKENGYY